MIKCGHCGNRQKFKAIAYVSETHIVDGDGYFKDRINDRQEVIYYQEQEDWVCADCGSPVDREKMYYRIHPSFEGEKATFAPSQKHEKWILVDASPCVQGIWLGDEFCPSVHHEAEVCFGKELYGCFFAKASELEAGEYFIYKTNQEPNADLSSEELMDFSISKEVRYNKPVEAEFDSALRFSEFQVSEIKLLLQAFNNGWVPKENIIRIMEGIISPVGYAC